MSDRTVTPEVAGSSPVAPVISTPHRLAEDVEEEALCAGGGPRPLVRVDLSCALLQLRDRLRRDGRPRGHRLHRSRGGRGELTEAALVDGASVWMIYRKVILPLCRPALAALATLEFTFMYNDFFWALFLMKDGDRRPITSALNNLQGAFFTDQNQLAAASLIVAIPTIVVYLVLSKQFVRGLTLGSTKG